MSAADHSRASLYDAIEHQCMEMLADDMAPTFVLLGKQEMERIGIQSGDLSEDNIPVFEVSGIELIAFPVPYLETFLQVCGDQRVIGEGAGQLVYQPSPTVKQSRPIFQMTIGQA